MPNQIRYGRENKNLAALPSRLIFLLLFGALTFVCKGQRLTPLSTPPDWGRLDQFQETITREEFTELLETVYAPDHASWIAIEPEQASIVAHRTDRFVLRFAKSPLLRRTIPRYWKALSDLKREQDKPLKGLRIALDPGHLGGSWARVEERWFQIGSTPPVAEGDLTLRVAQLLAPRLQELGAEVLFVRSESGPVTGLRPEQLKSQAAASLADRGVPNAVATYSGPADPKRELSIEWEAERLFYRIAEIHERACIVNGTLRPDLVLCLHFNAEPWGDPAHPILVKANHFHLLVNGSYSPSELSYEDERFAMLVKLLNQVYPEELGCAEAVGRSFAAITGLPPYSYATPNARRAGNTGFVWARNLLANRLYECPVVYIEPYVMNNEEVFARIQAGEYEGMRDFGGTPRRNIFEEYVSSVVSGLIEYSKNNPAK